jgi:hypothetical protein
MQYHSEDYLKIKIPYTWALANSSRFNQDAIRRDCISYRAKRLSCFISKQSESDVKEIREWLEENEISDYVMFGVFTDHPDRVYYDGLSFEFKSEDSLLFFKLRFF